MQVIPVIDLKAGRVVRARAGARHLYAPIETPLARTSRPADVVSGLLSLHPFRALYVADLDAIEGSGTHADVIAGLEAAFPALTFWVDSAIACEATAKAWLATHRGDLVVGSESLPDVATSMPLLAVPRSLLSLDFRGDAFQGPPRLASDEALWPPRLIVMTLARVGAGNGPDFDRLRAIQTIAAGRHTLYAAGGVRGPADLDRLQTIGVSGVLVASALHDGRITTQHLAGA